MVTFFAYVVDLFYICRSFLHNVTKSFQYYVEGFTFVGILTFDGLTIVYAMEGYGILTRRGYLFIVAYARSGNLYSLSFRKKHLGKIITDVIWKLILIVVRCRPLRKLVHVTTSLPPALRLNQSLDSLQNGKEPWTVARDDSPQARIGCLFGPRRVSLTRLTGRPPPLALLSFMPCMAEVFASQLLLSRDVRSCFERWTRNLHDLRYAHCLLAPLPTSLQLQTNLDAVI